MKKSNPAAIELIPSPSTVLRMGVTEAEFNQRVQQEVAKVMAQRDAFVFEPFFRNRQVAYALKRLQNVPEQRKFSIAFERYGCMVCETRERIHAGNCLCANCHQLWFRRFAQIIAEGISGKIRQPAEQEKPARPANGASRTDRLLPPTALRDCVPRCWYKHGNETDRLLYRRVAEQMGVSPAHVRSVARGLRHSEAISAALKKEAKRLCNGGDE